MKILKGVLFFFFYGLLLSLFRLHIDVHLFVTDATVLLRLSDQLPTIINNAGLVKAFRPLFVGFVDLTLTLCLLISSIWLVFLREWARKLYQVTLILILLAYSLGVDFSAFDLYFYLIWTIPCLAALYYFTRPGIEKQFRK